MSALRTAVICSLKDRLEGLLPDDRLAMTIVADAKADGLGEDLSVEIRNRCSSLKPDNRRDDRAASYVLEDRRSSGEWRVVFEYADPREAQHAEALLRTYGAVVRTKFVPQPLT